MKIKDAMKDFREELLTIIFKGYPDHKKMWRAEEIENAIASTMYNIAVDYVDKYDVDNTKEMNLEIDRLLEEIRLLKEFQ